jgi:hypothetical protein
MDPRRYRKAYEAMLHTTHLIEERLHQDEELPEENVDQDEAPKPAFQEQDPDSMEWEPTESDAAPAACGPLQPLSKKMRQFLPEGNGDYLAEERGVNSVLLHKSKEGVIMDACIDKLVRDLPDVLKYDDVLSFTPSTIEVPKDFGLQLSISINHHLAQVADRKALEKYRRLLGHRRDLSKRKQVKLGFDPVDLIKKQAVTFSANVTEPICTLDNDIHTIFRLDNWHGCPDAIYEVLKPGLRLATQLLTSRGTAHFWQTLVFGEREPCAETSQLYGQPCFRIRETVAWSADRHETFKNFLENQTDTVHFYFHHDPLPPETAYASMGLVKDYKNGLMRKISDKCHTSRICLHSDFYTTAKKLSLLQYPEPAMVLRFNLFLAICLTHEVSHFCEVSGPHHDHPLLSAPEVFFGDNMWTESGIAFETNVFGGRIHPLSSRIDCSFGLACLDYPLKELYDKDDNVLYALPMDYILKLQQRDTWEQDFSKVGNDVFFVPRTGGRSYEINGTNLMIWEDESDADISDHVDGQDTEWMRMDDGSIARNPKANGRERRPQRLTAEKRWSPYGGKRKATVGAEVEVEKVAVDVEGEEERSRSGSVEAGPEEGEEKVQEESPVGEDGGEVKALTDQDML